MDPPEVKNGDVKVGRRTVPRWLILGLTYAVSLVSLVWALRGYDFSQIKLAILSVKWGWVLLAVLLELAVYVLQAWRWMALLNPIERMGLWETVQAIYI